MRDFEAAMARVRRGFDGGMCVDGLMDGGMDGLMEGGVFPFPHSHFQKRNKSNNQVRPTGASAQDYQQRESQHAAHTARANPAFINAAMLHFIQSMMEGGQPGGAAAAAAANGHGASRPDPGVE